MFSDRFKLSYINLANEIKSKQKVNMNKSTNRIKQLVYCHPLFTLKKHKLVLSTKNIHSNCCSITNTNRSGTFMEFSEKINKKTSLTNDDKNILASFLLSNKIIKNKKTFKFPSISKSTINIKSDIKPKKETKNKTRNSSLNNKYNLYEEQSINDEYRKVYQMKKVSNAFSNSLLKSILMRKADDDLTKIMNTEAKNVTNSHMINPLYKGYRVIMKRCSNVN